MFALTLLTQDDLLSAGAWAAIGWTGSRAEISVRLALELAPHVRDQIPRVGAQVAINLSVTAQTVFWTVQ